MKAKNGSVVLNKPENVKSAETNFEVAGIVMEPRMGIGSIAKSTRSGAEKIVLYAPEGWGKTTWASKSESPVFLSTEDGLKSVTVDKFPTPETWKDVFEAVESLRARKHEYKTLVIDTADWTEHLCQKWLLSRDNMESIENYGYGKGYVLAFEEWKRLLSPLDKLRTEKNISIIFLAHSQIKTFNNPSGENYDRYELKTHLKVSALLKEWSDCVLFGSYDVAIDIKKGQAKGKGYGGERIIHANYSPAFDAKNRYGITTHMSSEFSEFWSLVKGGTNGTKTENKN